MALLLTMTAALMASVVAYSQDRITSSEKALSDGLLMSTAKVTEMITFLGFQAGPEGIAVDLLNYGKHPVKIKKVLVDGNSSSFEITSYGNLLDDALPVGKPVVLKAPVAGRTIQIITGGGNLLALP